MRAIKFRIWDKQENKFLTSEFAEDPIGYSLEALRFFYKIEDKSIKISDRYVFQEFTGLKDKNNREIYEGDVCFYDDVKDAYRPTKTGLIVWYDDFCWAFSHDQIDKTRVWFLNSSFDFQKVQVIGNIFQHSNLLK